MNAHLLSALEIGLLLAAPFFLFAVLAGIAEFIERNEEA